MSDARLVQYAFAIATTLLLAGCQSNGGNTNHVDQAASAVQSRDIVALTAGDRHACALDSGGAVLCWGSNFSGQLGDGSHDDAYAPVAAGAWSSHVSAVSAGMSFSCALIAGGVQCLGGNQHGQLGDGTNLDSLQAVNVTGLGSGISAIAAGMHFLCGLTAGGGVRCLGDNHYGQVGDGTTTDAYAAKDVQGLGAVTALAAGQDAACALSGDGSVKCWGNNGYEELGSGATTISTVPLQAYGLTSGVAAVAPGQDFSCVLTTAGGASCIGNNTVGQIGSGSPEQAMLPYTVRYLNSGLTAVVAGRDFACALTDAGAVKCWGNNNYGQLGDGTTDSARQPVDVTGLDSGIRAITAGPDFACAVDAGGAVLCWGHNNAGQLGNGIPGMTAKPLPVSGLASGVTAVSAGADFTCALTAAGTVQCWGNGSNGQLGNGTTLSTRRPVTVNGLAANVTAISAGYSHACALDAAGGIQCWGGNARGQLGDGSRNDSAAPVTVDGLSGNIVAVTAGNLTTCALNTTGAVQCWGDGAYGELGNGGTTGSLRPVTVTGLGGGASAIAASQVRNAVCAVVGGALRCWGDESIHRLITTADHSAVPVAITGLDQGVTALAMGAHHACIVNRDGGVQCWGSNGRGELGGGGTAAGYSSEGADAAHTPLAVTVNGLSGVTAIAAGRNFSCALTAAGEVSCWGANDHGQLGNGTVVDSAVPVQVSGLSGATAIVAGGDFACALAAGAVKCWGANDAGQLGTHAAGSYPKSTVAVDVM